MQTAAQRHVQFLKTAADRKNWHPALDGPTNQRKRHVVSFGVFRCIFGRLRRTAVENGGYIASATGQNEAIEPGKNRVDIGMLAVCRNQQRNATYDAIDGTDICIRSRMINHSKHAEKFSTTGNADQFG